MKRHLRPSVEKVLILITTVLFIFCVSINDFKLSFIPVYLLLWSVVLINIHIIHKYGNGSVYKEDLWLKKW